jgi:dolichol-phosphate mannosyltransferase
MTRESSPNFSTPAGELSKGERRSVITCSVIIPVYNQRENIRAAHQALCAMAQEEPSLDWEFVFVEDGSTDDTFAILVELNRTDPRVKVVRLSRNYGSHTCAAAGLQFASGHAAVLMTGDMQVHPREISRFLAKWREGFHVVWGVRTTRHDGRIDRFLSSASSALIRYVALPGYPRQGIASFCLLDRKVIDALNNFPERNRVTFGLVLSAGFRQTYIEYDRPVPHSGVLKRSVRGEVKHTIDTVVSFSSLPIRLTSVVGIAIATLSIVYAVYLAVDALIGGRAVEGWTSIVVLVMILGGLQLFVLGMLGEYLWRVCDEVRRRPLFLVQDVTGAFPSRDA